MRERPLWRTILLVRGDAVSLSRDGPEKVS
jgi:hypothetical protein